METLELGTPHLNGSAGASPSLRALIAEHAGGRLAALIADFPDGIPVEFEVEDHLDVVASLAAQNAFDIVVIGESLIGHRVAASVVESLADASHTTPILVLGETIPELNGGVETGTIRVVAPSEVTPATLLREVRFTMEMHVMNHEKRSDQSRRVQSLKRIFEHMIDRMPYAVAVTDPDGFIRCVNRAACALWDRGETDVLGSLLVDHPEDGKVEILNVGARRTPVEVAPVPIDWLGQRYFLTSVRRMN